MTNKEGKDTLFELEKRIEASKKVNLCFADFNFERFTVHDKDGNQTHEGKIDLKNPLDSTCSCDSFLYGMRFYKEEEYDIKIQSRHVNETGEVFKCKHLIKARYLRTVRPGGIEA